MLIMYSRVNGIYCSVIAVTSYTERVLIKVYKAFTIFEYYEWHQRLKQLFNEWQQLKWTLDSFRLACNVWFVLFQHWRKIRMAKSCIKCWNFNEMGFKCWRQQNDELNFTTYVSFFCFFLSLFNYFLFERHIRNHMKTMTTLTITASVQIFTLFCKQTKYSYSYM